MSNRSAQSRDGLSRLAAAAAVGALAASLACAPKTPPTALARPTGYAQLERAAAPAAGFEAMPGEVDPADVVGLRLLQGPHHVVRSARLDERLLYTFVVDSRFGELEVEGLGLLRKRVLELEALAAFEERGLNPAEVYALDAAHAAEEPLEDTLQIVRHPVRTVRQIPGGVARSYKSVRQMTRGGRTNAEDAYTTEMIGLSAQKRLWAERLGVDPYSTNPHVQARLTRNAWASLLGQLSVRAATIPVPGAGATIALSAVGATSSMSEPPAHEAPEDVRVQTRAYLTGELGTDLALAEAFLAHPWYPPTSQETILRSLARLGGVAGRERFIELAVRADQEREAYAFTRLALLLAESHMREAPLAELFVVNDLLAARTLSGRVVVPLYVDHLPWTQPVAEAEADLRRALDAAHAADAAEPVLLLSGELTPRAERELTERGWRVVPHLEAGWLRTLDLAQHRPAEPDPERLLPELGDWAAHAGWRVAEQREPTAGEDATGMARVAHATVETQTASLEPDRPDEMLGAAPLAEMAEMAEIDHLKATGAPGERLAARTGVELAEPADSEMMVEPPWLAPLGESSAAE